VAGGLTVRRGLAVVAACLCAGGGVAVAWADSGSGDDDDPSLFTYDTLLGETVPIANDADLRAMYFRSKSGEKVIYAISTGKAHLVPANSHTAATTG
jgi:hypothetical protein